MFVVASPGNYLHGQDPAFHKRVASSPWAAVVAFLSCNLFDLTSEARLKRRTTWTAVYIWNAEALGLTPSALSLC